MNCSNCNSQNDEDARFCSECGTALVPAGKNRKVYLYALFLIPVVILAAAVGYYKFFLPQGVAAFVNGEEISVAELDRVVARATNGSTDSRLRYQVLNSLITDRLAFQAARKAGFDATQQELTEAATALQSRSGLTESGFRLQAEKEYGSMRAFEENVKRGLIIKKFVAARVVPANTDRQSADRAINSWLRSLSADAVVRVTLSEDLPAGCGCGTQSPAPAAAAASGCRMAGAGCAMAGRNRVSASGDADKARAAALRYWHEHYGADKVTTKITDFGCHVQVDILKDNKQVGSLRYQAGTISEF